MLNNVVHQFDNEWNEPVLFWCVGVVNLEYQLLNQHMRFGKQWVENIPDGLEMRVVSDGIRIGVQPEYLL